jgi:hypothetical protein
MRVAHVSDPAENRSSEDRSADIALPPPRFPAWLAARLLREGENVEWVSGPRAAPRWEPFATHPLFILAAATVAAAWVGLTLHKVGSVQDLPPLPVLGAGAILVGSIFIVGACCGYFTRLIVTNLRLIIVQGHTVRRCLSIDDLPMSLIRYRRVPGSELTRTVDLDALKTMLGGPSAEVADSKTILALGKKLANIRAQDEPKS